MATKRPAGGTIVAISTSTSNDWLGPWTTIPGIMGSVSLPGGQAQKVDITTHDDITTYGRFRQNGAGISDVTDPSWTMLWDPDDATHAILLAAFTAGSTRDFRFTFPNVTKKYGVNGQVSIGNGQADVGDYLKYQVTVTANKINFNVT